MRQLESHACFGGTVEVWEHDSAALSCAMKFSIFLPPQGKEGKVPLVTFLSGLTCTHENFTHKAGAYGAAAELGLAILAPDTSPRGDDVPDDADAYDFGKGAGFYLDATQQPWAKNYRMESYITQELNNLVSHEFPVTKDCQSIMGHSMGGHGALTLYFRHPGLYRSVSAFSPIVAPSQVPWGEKAFSRYLGEDRALWAEHDATALVAGRDVSGNAEILIDQGLADNFLTEQLKPQLFKEACSKAGQKLNLRLHEGYDHSYYFIASLIEAHLRFHAQHLARA